MTEVIVTVDNRKQIETLMQNASKRDSELKNMEAQTRGELNHLNQKVQAFESDLIAWHERVEENKRD
jgi:hypothetical protein